MEFNCLLPVHTKPNYIHGQNTNQVNHCKVARRDIDFSTQHDEILIQSTALFLIKTLFSLSLWYCIYTLQYSAKKQNVQLHKYKILPPCLMAKIFRELHHNAVMNPAKKTKKIFKNELALSPLHEVKVSNRLDTQLYIQGKIKSKRHETK